MSSEIEVIDEMIETRKRLIRMEGEALLTTDWQDTELSEEVALREYLEDSGKMRVEINVLSRLRRRLVNE